MPRRCIRRKRVRIKSGPQKGRMVMRCAAFSGTPRRGLSGLGRARKRKSGTKGKTCIRFKRTSAGRRCAKFSGGGLSGLGRTRRRSGTKGKKCVRFKRTSAGRRCASFGSLGRKLRGHTKTCTQYARYPKAGGGTVVRCAVYEHGGKGRRKPSGGIRRAAGLKRKYTYRSQTKKARVASAKSAGGRRFTHHGRPQPLRARKR